MLLVKDKGSFIKEEADLQFQLLEMDFKGELAKQIHHCSDCKFKFRLTLTEDFELGFCEFQYDQANPSAWRRRKQGSFQGQALYFVVILAKN